MSNFYHRLRGAAIATLLVLTAGCSGISLPNKNATLRSGANSATRSVASSEAATLCPQSDPLTKAIGKAQNAATLAQSAQSRQQWDVVVSQWIQAIEAMQSVPSDSPRRPFAQKKLAEYLKNLNIAQLKAATITSQLPFSSFDNQIFDEQLLLYLSYIAAMGTPDVLIVGSSRALVGLDPTQLQQALAAQGKGNLKIFNFAVNGGTAQMVDFQLRQLLTRDQLPRLILWADGVRAFNSGRSDRTYSSLVASQGYKRLKVGDRPRLPQGKSETTEACDAIPGTSMSSAIPLKSNASAGSASSTATTEDWRLSRLSLENTSNSVSSSDERSLSTQPTDELIAQRLPLGRSTNSYSSSAIDANGFLPLDNRFNPEIYYQKNPQVTGRYDSDYQPFSLAGQQAVALNSIKALARQQKIPLVVVNLPLTQDYLDSVRQNREQQFLQWMQRQVSPGFVFINLGSQWTTEYKYFTDPSHLNRYGAAAVANLLAANRQIPWPQPRL